MDAILNDLEHAWQAGVVDPGKVAEFLLYVSFLVTFAFIRFSTHMIRAQVSWWPGNIETSGGTHLHHMVFGISGLLLIGWAMFAFDPGSPWTELLAVLWGVAAGLTLDEFALWVNLEDVYWAPKGRQSIDAVIVAAGLMGIVLLGVRVWADLGRQLEEVVAAIGVFAWAVAILNLLKGKLFMAMLSILLPPAGLPSIVRLARPDSPWVRLYGEEKRARARERFPEPWLPARLKARRNRERPAPPEPAAS